MPFWKNLFFFEKYWWKNCKGGFFSESEIRFSNLQKKVFQKTGRAKHNIGQHYNITTLECCNVVSIFFQCCKKLKKKKIYCCLWWLWLWLRWQWWFQKLISLSINLKHDIKLFCGFTHIAHKLSTNCTWGQFLYKVCFILRKSPNNLLSIFGLIEKIMHH